MTWFNGNNFRRVSVGSGVNGWKTLLHEILHALGFMHEQCRPDRNDYVVVDLTNAVGDEAGQYEICDSCVTNNVAYDYESIMHYPDHNNGVVMTGAPTPTDRSINPAHGSPTRMAFAYYNINPWMTADDIAGINAAYAAPAAAPTP